MYENFLKFVSFIVFVNNVSCGRPLKAEEESPRVCVLGAGLAGLTSAKYLQEEGIKFDVLEATKYIGGTWRYDPRVGTDENGLILYTSMYDHLRTNLPKPTMELRGYPLPENTSSFPTRKQYYDYLQGYAKHYHLEKHIKFLHLVTNVSRESDVWKVKHKHVLTGEEFEDEYDFVFVGTGHYSKPKYPSIPGEKLFKGKRTHSHDYRKPDIFKGRRVLVIGAGPSGMDIALDVAEVSSKLIHSHHSPVTFRTPWPENYLRKRDVKEFKETGAIFVDGTFEEFDDVIYCTGYEYWYPFLDESCGLTITPTSVTPLYRYLVNVNQPTMVVMGLVVRACLALAIDAQARYATALAKGNFTLPSKEGMMQEWQKRANAIQSRGWKMTYIHHLADKEDEYYADLTKESGIERVPPVMFKIRALDTEAKLDNLYTYRNYRYYVKDSETFTRQLEDSCRMDNSCNNSLFP